MNLSNHLVMTEFDHNRLERLLDMRRGQNGMNAANFDALEDELERAQVVDPAEIPPNVVTMNSEVQLTDLDTQGTLRLTVVFPHEADFEAGKISVLAPLGLALLGSRVGEELAWLAPGRNKRRLVVDDIVFQPEASRRFDL